MLRDGSAIGGQDHITHGQQRPRAKSNRLRRNSFGRSTV